MNTFLIAPEIKIFQTVQDFLKEFSLTENDLLFISDHTLHNFFSNTSVPSRVVSLRKYGSGEPTDEMVRAICQELQDVSYQRVLAIGGGTILDVAKLFALDQILPVSNLFNREFPIKKSKELILIPTTCGTGSEVTNISILEFPSLKTKKGLSDPSLFADTAVIIPELIEGLPYQYFATSSLDALIHALESYLSPKASPFSEMYSLKAIELILKGYQYISVRGQDSRAEYAENFMLASTYAGIAFGNAGCAAVHALSYPLGAVYHIPHGEANYSVLLGVIRAYQSLLPHGKLMSLSNFLADILHCCASEAFDEFEGLLQSILPRKKLSVYGITMEQLQEFTTSVIHNQQRLLANNYVALSFQNIYEIYQSVF